MSILYIYLAVSLAIGVCFAISFFSLTPPDKESFERARNSFLSEQVKKGNLQHEQYGERQVYYRQTHFWGIVAEKTDERVTKLWQRRGLYNAILFCFIVVTTAFTWPKIMVMTIADKLFPPS